MITNETIVKNSKNRFLNSTPFYSDFRGGLNVVNNQAELNVNELWQAKNVMFNLDMGIIPRFGVKKIINTPFPQNVDKILGLYQARFSKGNIIIACSGSYIYAWFNNSWVNLSQNLNRSQASEFSFTMFRDKLIICDGVNYPVSVEFNGTNFVVSELTNAPLDVRKCKLVITWVGRLFFSVNGTNKIYFTEVNQENNFPTNNVFSIGGIDDSAPITSINALSGNLIVFKNNSIYQVYVSSTDTGFSFTVNLITNNNGCLVEKCSVVAENYVYFLGLNGLWRISSGFAIEYLSNKLLTHFQSLKYYNSGSETPKIAYNNYFRQIWLSVGFVSANVKDRVYVYDIANNCFSIYEFFKDNTKNLNPNCLTDYINSENIRKLIGTNDLYVYEFDVLDYNGDDGNFSYAVIETKLFNLGDPLKYKTVVSYNVNGYAGFGYSENGNTEIISTYNISTNTFNNNEINDLLSVRGHSAFLSSNKAFITGGYSTEYSNKLRIIDLQTNTIYYGSDMPKKLAFHTSVVYNNKLYVFGGYNEFGVNSEILVYDIQNNSWEILPTQYNMPTPRYFLEGFLYGSKVFLIGGFDGNGNVSNKNEVFDLSTFTWETKQNTPNAIALFSGCVYNNLIYIIGGYPAGINGDKILVYNISNDTYSFKNFYLPQKIFQHRVILSGYNAYIIGGYYFEGSKKIYLYNLQTDNISLAYDMPFERYWFASFLYGSKIYICGGVSFNTPKIFFKVSNDFVNFTTYEYNLVLNKDVGTVWLSNEMYKFISVGFKAKVNSGFVRFNSFYLNYFMWDRRV